MDQQPGRLIPWHSVQQFERRPRQTPGMCNRRARRRARASRATRRNTPKATNRHSISLSARPRQLPILQGIEDHSCGLVTYLKVPGGFKVRLYAPRYRKQSACRAQPNQRRAAVVNARVGTGTASARFAGAAPQSEPFRDFASMSASFVRP